MYLTDMAPEEIQALLESWGEPSFRCKQVISWLLAV